MRRTSLFPLLTDEQKVKMIKEYDGIPCDRGGKNKDRYLVDLLWRKWGISASYLRWVISHRERFESSIGGK